MQQTAPLHALTDAFADVGEVRLHYVTAGTGPLVVLLHGFPDFWFTWRHQIPRLAAAGHRVVAVDLRGYNLSDKPAGVRAYGVDRLVADVAGLITALGETRAFVVGHDWGAGVAWAFAMTHPEMVERLAILNGPHPQKFLMGLRSPVQLAKSWYMFFFQLPWLPEAIAQMDGFKLFVSALRDEPNHPPSPDELERYREAWAQPGALEAMINYYRAMFRPSAAVKLRKLEMPVLVIWGDADPHLGAELAEPERSLVPLVRVEHLPTATHWVQHDEPRRVGDLLVEFFGQAASDGAPVSE